MIRKHANIVIISQYDKKYFTVEVHPRVTNGLVLLFKLSSVVGGHLLVWLILTEPESELLLSLQISFSRLW